MLITINKFLKNILKHRFSIIIILLLFFIFYKIYLSNSNKEGLTMTDDTCPCNCKPPILSSNKCSTSQNNSKELIKLCNENPGDPKCQDLKDDFKICSWSCFDYDPTNPSSCVYDEDCKGCTPKYGFKIAPQ